MTSSLCSISHTDFHALQKKFYFDLIITLQRYHHRQNTDCDWGVNPMSAVGRGMVPL